MNSRHYWLIAALLMSGNAVAKKQPMTEQQLIAFLEFLGEGSVQDDKLVLAIDMLNVDVEKATVSSIKPVTNNKLTKATAMSIDNKKATVIGQPAMGHHNEK